MKLDTNKDIRAVLQDNQEAIVDDWLSDLKHPETMSTGSISDDDLRSQCREFFDLLKDAVSAGNLATINGAAWDPVKEMLADISRSRAKQGYSPTDVAKFVLSLSKPVARSIGQAHGTNDPALFVKLGAFSDVLSNLALWTGEVFQKSREELISRQQADMLEISTPVVKLWDGILALPIIGTLDSARTQVVMENLLQAIVDTGSEIAIIDITGVPTVDTLVSQHLLKTVAAAQLMGADCIICGIRPQIAQTIVHLGVDLTSVTTKTTLEDAFRLALRKTGASVARAGIN